MLFSSNVMNMEEINDIRIKQAAKGDRQAFKDLYDHYSPYVWKVVYRTVSGDAYKAENIMQNTFIKIHDKLGNYKFGAALSTWIYRIAFNESMLFLKRESKRNKRDVSLDENVISSKLNDSFADKDEVNVILDTLSPDERFLLVAREVEGFSYEELSLMTGKKEGALRTTLSRLKNDIRGRFKDEG